LIFILRKYFFQHASLIVLMFGALSFFASNIIMKEILSAETYGYLSVFVTYFSFIYVFGIFGTEQVFIRFSRVENKNEILTQKSILYLILFFALFSSVTGTILFRHLYPEIQLNFFVLILVSLSIIGSTFLVSTFRLNSNFVLSQLLSNVWKIAMFLLAIFFLIYKYSDLSLFLLLVSLITISCFFFFLFYILKKIKFEFNSIISNNRILESSFHFFVSISSFSLIVFADRFIVEHKYSFEQFGNFFYLTSFFLSPFSILQNYIGFKQLIFFKNNFTISYFLKFRKKVILLGFLMAFALCCVTFFLSYFKWLSFPFDQYLSVIAMFLISGITRLYSSSISSAFEAKTSIETLRKSNLIIVLITIVILLFTFIFVNSIEIIILNMTLIWLLRSIICKKLLLNQIKNDE